MKKSLFAVLFFLSGFCGLVYQILWTRLFTTVLGNTYLAISIIVSSFLLGLLAGAWLIGRTLPRCRNPLEWYAALELGIGLYALLLMVSFGAVREVYQVLQSLLAAFPRGLSLAQFLPTMGIILPPTAAMGATLPLMVEQFTRRQEEFGRNISLFYAVNTLGGAAGALAAGFLIIEFLGISAGIGATALLNLLIGLTVWWRCTAAGSTPVETAVPSVSAAESPSSGEARPQGPSRNRFLFLLAAFLSGFAALSLEIIWTRALKFFLLNSTYGFAVILFVFLIGIGAGSLIYPKYFGGRRRTLHIYGTLQFGHAFFALLSIFLLYRFSYSDVMQQSVMQVIFDIAFDWWLVIAMFLFLAMMIFLVPALLMGVLFPMISDLYHDEVRPRPGATVSVVYAVNTLGSILGALLAGYFLLPAVGIRTSIYLVSLIYLGMGLLFYRRSHRPSIRVSVALLVMLIAAALLSREGETLMGRHERPTDRLYYYKEGLLATVKVAEQDQERYMSIDGVKIAASRGNLLQKEKLLAHLPFFINRDIQQALVVGLASGITTGSLALHRTLQSIDCVELIPPVFTAARYFSSFNYDVFSNSKVRLIHDDIYAYLNRSRKQYDLICSDGKIGSLNSGNSLMLSREYYQLCLSRLSAQGLLIQWIPITTPHAEFKLILHTLEDVFPHVANFYFYPSDVLMVASRQKLTLNSSDMAALFQEKFIQVELGDFELRNPAAVLSAYLGESRLPAGEHLPVNSLNRPLLEFRYLREWKKARLISGGYRAQNMEFLSARYRETDAQQLSTVFEQIDPARIEEQIRRPTLAFLEFALINFRQGGYLWGLQEYKKFKNNLQL